MAKVTKDCGCSSYTPCSPVTCISYVAPACDAFNLSASNTLSNTGISDVTDVTLDVKKISAYKEHLEFVNSPKGLSNIVGHTVLRLSNKFLTGVANLFKGRSLGTGAKIYKGATVVGADTFQDFRTLKGSESILVNEGTDEVTVSVDPTWLNGEFPVVNYPVIESEDIGTGTSLRKDVSSKKVGIRTLQSDDFIIAEQIDGSVKISSPGGGSNSNDYYLDVNFVRPSNWLSKAEEIDGIKTATGALNDPFKSYKEYLRRVIGETGGSNANGPYSRVNPKNPNKVLQVLTNVTTSEVLEINNSTLSLKNNSTVAYTGTEEYAINTERLWDAMPKTLGVLDRNVSFTVRGEGAVYNRFYSGVINHKTSSTSTNTTVKSIVNIIGEGSGLKFYDVNESATYTPMTGPDNITPFLQGGVQTNGTTKLPTTPLIKIKGMNNIDWGAIISGTKIYLQTNFQTALEVTDQGSLTCGSDELVYLINTNFFGYEKKLYPGLAGMTADETEILGVLNVFFKPYSERNVFRVKNGSTLRIERLSTVSDVKYEVGVNAIFKISEASKINCLDRFKELGGGTSVSFIEALGNENKVSIFNSSQSSPNRYFVKGDGSNTLAFSFVNSQNNSATIIKKDIPTLNISTSGTFSTVKGIPINSGIVPYTDNAAAVAAGLLVGMFYQNTTTNTLTQVI